MEVEDKEVVFLVINCTSEIMVVVFQGLMVGKMIMR